MQYIPWQGTSGKHALHLLRTLCREEWLQQPNLFQVQIDNGAKALFFGSKEKAKWKYDKHACYLPAFNIALGAGQPEYYTGPFLNRPGLWRFGEEYLWTPEAKRQVSLGQRPDAGWIWQEQHHILGPVYDYLTWWYKQSEPGSGARDLVKMTYTHLIGLLAHSQEREQADYIYRPDWRNLIISEAKVRLLAQIEKVKVFDGIEPVAAKVDALYYTRKVTTLPLGSGIGQFSEEAV